ncbi:MAG: cell division protein FtsA [Psychrilyobacter sp.]|nr:cell division protein FtsA [Psychrilyobacter sp.]
MRRIRTGIDIGSSKTTIVVGELYDAGKSIKILDQVIVPSNGIKKGKIIDGELFSKSIKRGLERIETKLDIKIDKATIGVSGSDIKSSTTEIEYKLSDEEIEVTLEHCKQILEISKKKVVKNDEQVITKEIYNYRVDDSGIMKSPIGKVGNKLKASVHLVRISKTRVSKIIETMNKSDIEVENIVYNGEASSKATLKTIDKINGVALIDIGYGLVDMTIFKNNKLISTNVIPIGGMHYINDLKYVLELEGEIVKNLLSEMKGKKIDEKVTIKFLEKSEEKSKTYDIKYLRDIIDARTDEMLNYISSTIEASGYKEYLKNGVILTGGVVESYEILDKLKKLLGPNIKIGKTIKINGMTTKLKTPATTAGVGILLTALEDEYNNLEKKIGREEKKEEKSKKSTIINKEEKNVKTQTKDVKKELNIPKENLEKSKWKKWLSNFI